MTGFLAIVRMTLRTSFRNRTALFFTMGLAVLFMVVFGVLFGGNGPKLTIAVVDNDHSTLSKQFAGFVRDRSGLTVETGPGATEGDRLSHDKLVYVAVLGPGFGNADPLHPAIVTALSNASSAQSAAIAANVVSSLAATFAAANHLGSAPAIEVRAATNVTSTNIRAIDFLLPSMIAYLVLQSGINFVAIGLVDQRQRKVLRRFLATPLRPLQILAGNVIGGATTVLLQVAVLVALGLTVFGARTHGNWALALVAVLVGTAAFVAIGFLLTSVARTSEAARGLAAMIAFPMMFLSGIFFPIDGAPNWLQTIIHILPLTYLTDALHRVLNDGVGLDAVGMDLLVLAAWAVVCFTVATRSFRWE